MDATVPRTHNLLKLAVNCDLKMTEEQADSLQYVTIFNIEARYEEHKREFYRKCTKAYTENQVSTIKELREWLLQKTSR